VTSYVTQMRDVLAVRGVLSVWGCWMGVLWASLSTGAGKPDWGAEHP